MSDRTFLHDGETLLCSMHSSLALLVVSIIRGLLDAIVGTVILSGVVCAVAYFGFAAFPSWIVYAVIFVLSYALVIWRRWTVWKHASFRVTSDRILIQPPNSLFHPHLHTIKWPQYQESEVGGRSPLDLVFRSRAICVRHGTADAHLKTCFPSVRYAQDLKHYLDKVDSAFRRNDTASLHPFVAKPRGKRDGAQEESHA